MARRKQPVAVLRASGSRHYSKDALAAREAAEPKLARTAQIKPPPYLPASLREKFGEVAKVLTGLGVMAEVDADGLARYLLAEANYLRLSVRLTAAMNAGNLDAAYKLSSMQDRFFRQCRAAANDLGLTISSRCGLLVPPRQDGTEPDDDLFGDGEARG